MAAKKTTLPASAKKKVQPAAAAPRSGGKTTPSGATRPIEALPPWARNVAKKVVANKAAARKKGGK
jgi:hypothetical protein